MTKNPNWTRDELILALDLYFKHHPNSINNNHPEVIQLSNTLNSLPIHTKEFKDQKFRNPSGVYMKMCNFLRFDPNYTGTGLSRGSKLEEEVWNDFYNDKENLKKTANAIIENTTLNKIPITTDEDQEEFKEGKILTLIHKKRERNTKLVKQRKQKELNEKGFLRCEVCNFDFKQFYGDIGNGYIECHHIKPLNELLSETKTKISDLALVCANCHRMLHRSKNEININLLTKTIKTRSKHP